MNWSTNIKNWYQIRNVLQQQKFLNKWINILYLRYKQCRFFMFLLCFWRMTNSWVLIIFLRWTISIFSYLCCLCSLIWFCGWSFWELWQRRQGSIKGQCKYTFLKRPQNLPVLPASLPLILETKLKIHR